MTEPPLAVDLAFACVPVLVGTHVGFWLQDKLPAETFRRFVLGLIFVSGFSLVLRQLL